jgi:chorismate mutase/prephenate dehydratase
MDLVDWRERINQVDRRILDLLNKRVGYVLNLVPLKRQEGIPIHEPRRETQVLDNIKAENRGPLNSEAVCRIFKAVMTEMKAVQAEQNETENDSDTEK